MPRHEVGAAFRAGQRRNALTQTYECDEHSRQTNPERQHDISVTKCLCFDGGIALVFAINSRPDGNGDGCDDGEHDLENEGGGKNADCRPNVQFAALDQAAHVDEIRDINDEKNAETSLKALVKRGFVRALFVVC